MIRDIYKSSVVHEESHTEFKSNWFHNNLKTQAWLSPLFSFLEAASSSYFATWHRTLNNGLEVELTTALRGSPIRTVFLDFARDINQSAIDSDKIESYSMSPTSTTSKPRQSVPIIFLSLTSSWTPLSLAFKRQEANATGSISLATALTAPDFRAAIATAPLPEPKSKTFFPLVMVGLSKMYLTSSFYQKTDEDMAFR